MSTTQESLDQAIETQPKDKKAPGGVKALAVFTYIGKVLLILLSLGFLVGLFVAEDYMVNKVADADQNSDAWVLETQILCLVYLISSIGAIIGVNKMKKGKKKGFYLHAISNVLLIAFLAYNANIVEWIIAGSLALFILLYLPFVGKLKN